jgi:uncharacterized SAM-binding protein YcdF (DUF218 family)
VLFPLRLMFKLMSLVVALLVVYLGVTFVQVLMASRRDEARPAEAIVVFGAAQYNGRPSPVLRARLDHARSLYERNIAGVIMVTGGSQPGDTSTEAGASADYLAGRGVPQSAILRENQGRSSWQSLASAANELQKRGMQEVVLVSDPFHAARIEAMAEELGLNATVSPTRTSPIGGAEELVHLGRETVAVAAGRVVGFRRLMGVKGVAGQLRQEVEQRQE